jgi:hypothetical protein
MQAGTCSGACPAGTYSDASALADLVPVPRPVRAGLAVLQAAAPTAACYPALRGPTALRTGLTSSLCSGLRVAGTYSTGGATTSACTQCPAGVFGNTAGLTSALCSGPRPAGTYSTGGATSASCHALPRWRVRHGRLPVVRLHGALPRGHLLHGRRRDRGVHAVPTWACTAPPQG